MFEITDNSKSVISFYEKIFREFVEQFEKAKLFDGKTIYEAENEITVL